MPICNNPLFTVDDNKIKLPPVNSILSTKDYNQVSILSSPMLDHSTITMNPQPYYSFHDQSLPYNSPSVSRTPVQYIQNKYPTPESNSNTLASVNTSSNNPIITSSPSHSSSQQPQNVPSLAINPATSPINSSFQQIPASFYPSLPPPPPPPHPSHPSSSSVHTNTNTAPTNTTTTTTAPPPPPPNHQYYYPYHQATLPPHFPPTPPMGFSPNSMIPHVQSIHSNPYQTAPHPPSHTNTGYFDPSKFNPQSLANPQAAAAAAAAAVAASMIPPMPNNMAPMNPILNTNVHPTVPLHQHPGIPMMAGRPVKPKRKRATPEQTNRLNEVFAETFFPTSNQRMDLAMELGMSPRTVQIWFQNKRQGWRSEHRRPVPREPVPLNTDYLREQHEKTEQKQFDSENMSATHPSDLNPVSQLKLKQELLDSPQPLSQYHETFVQG